MLAVEAVLSTGIEFAALGISVHTAELVVTGRGKVLDRVDTALETTFNCGSPSLCERLGVAAGVTELDAISLVAGTAEVLSVTGVVRLTGACTKPWGYPDDKLDKGSSF